MEADFQKELERCVRCGRCRAVCPVFGATLRETDVARGRLIAIKELDKTPSSPYLDALSRCMLCGACEDNCQSAVPVTELVRQARAHHKLPAIKASTLRHVVTDRAKMKTATKAALALAKIVGEKSKEGSGLRLRFCLPHLLGDRRFPKPPDTDFLTLHGQTNPQGKVALFTGCVFTYLMPEVAEAGLAVLKDAGVAVAVPADQACCGMMAFGAGDDAAAQTAARKFIEGFDRYETILALCASCAVMLKEHLPKVHPAGEQIASRVEDVHEYLLRIGYQPKGRIDEKLLPLAWHAPCHLRFAHPSDAPLRLLQKMENSQFVDLEDDCCGFSGSYTLAHPDISRAIGEKRAAQIAAAAPRTVVTSCSGCLLGLYDLVKKSPVEVRILHSLQILSHIET